MRIRILNAVRLALLLGLLFPLAVWAEEPMPQAAPTQLPLKQPPPRPGGILPPTPTPTGILTSLTFGIYLPLVMKHYIPGAPTPTPTGTPTLTPTPPLGKPMAGLWKGQSVTDGYPAETRPITFTVEAGGTRIASGARIDTYFREENFFTCWGTMQWTVNFPISIAGDGTFHVFGGLIDTLTWDGRFVSSDRAEGTFHTEVLAGVCGKVINDGTWWATWQGSSTSTESSE